MANMLMLVFVCTMAMSNTVADPGNRSQRPMMSAYPKKNSYGNAVPKTGPRTIPYASKILPHM